MNAAVNALYAEFQHTGRGAAVAAAPQAVKTMVAAITSATKTYSCFFIMFLLLKIRLVEG